MAGEDGGNAAAAAPTQDATATEKRTYVNVMPLEEVEYLLSRDYSKPYPRRDDDDHNPHKDEWNDGVDTFNDLRMELAAKQAVIRAEYLIKGCVELDDDHVAMRSRLIHQVYLETKAAAAAADHRGDFVETLNRDQEDDDDE